VRYFEAYQVDFVARVQFAICTFAKIIFFKMSIPKLIRLSIVSISFSFNSSSVIANMQPQKGNIEVPTNSQLRVWMDVQLSIFDVVLTHLTAKQCCKVCCEKSDEKGKWVNPSFLFKTSISVTTPATGYLLLKNFNANTIIQNDHLRQIAAFLSIIDASLSRIRKKILSE
jgi:hypothetical protein